MMNRRTLRKFRSPNDTKKFNENKSSMVAYACHSKITNCLSIFIVVFQFFVHIFRFN